MGNPKIRAYHRYSSYFLLFLFLIACEPPTNAPTTGNISGTILDATTTQPISGATITTDPVTSSKTTDSEGAYTIEGVEPGTYTVQASKTGYQTNSTIINVIAGETASGDIQLTPLGPELTVSATMLNFGTSSTNLTFTISNSGIGTLTWSVISSSNWVTVNPTSGTTESETDVVTVTVDRTAMAYGNHYETITVASNANSSTIDIVMTVPNPNAPQLSVYPISLDFSTSETEMTFYVSNTGTGLLTWNITDDKPWISVDPQSGTTESEIDEITVTIDRLGQSSGTYAGTVSVSSDGGNQSVTVSFTVPDEPLLSISPMSLDFGISMTSLSFDVANAGSGNLTWSVTDNQEWITTSPSSGTNYGTVNVTVSRDGLSPGDYSGTVTVSSNGGTGDVAVLMNVPADEPPTAVTLADPTDITSNSMVLTWSRSYDADFAAYQLYYDTSPAVTENSTLATTITDNNLNSHTVTGLSANTTYYFRVYVMDSANQTTGSNVVSGTTSTVLGNWSLVTNISDVTFRAVYFNSENDGYAVGYTEYYPYGGRIYHTSGATWSAETIPSSYGLYDVRFLDANNGYAVGDAGEFLHFNGITWSEFESPTSSFIGSVFPLATNDVWCYSGTTIYHWDGSTWSEVNLDISTIKDIFFINASDGWVVDTSGKMYHYNGIGWAFHSDLASRSRELFTFLNSSEGWYVYSDPSSSSTNYNGAYHYDGTDWTRYENTEHPIYKVTELYEVSPSNVWAVGYDGVIFNYSGSAWKRVTSPTTDDLNGLFMLSSSDGWAVGSNGVILRYH